MSDDKFQNRYRIPSARYKWDGYDNGAYFVTICTKYREHFFGSISNGQMVLSTVGKYLSENVKNVNIHYPYAEIPVFVVMPNHLHAIIFIDRNKTPYPRRDAARRRGATLRRDAARHVSTGDAIMREIAFQQGWVSVVIGGLKSAITKFANANTIDFAWQSRFHDHSIKSINEMNHIAEYIDNNILQWESDIFYKDL